jgi:hypothetical protein
VNNKIKGIVDLGRLFKKSFEYVDVLKPPAIHSELFEQYITADRIIASKRVQHLLYRA